MSGRFHWDVHEKIPGVVDSTMVVGYVYDPVTRTRLKAVIEVHRSLSEVERRRIEQNIVRMLSGGEA